MQAIILAAGRGTRMAPLTDTTPKPMLKVLDKNLIEWKLEALPENVKEIILVVGYLSEQITNHFGNMWKGIPISYVEQHELNGTAGSLMLCESLIHDKAIILMGDDIYDTHDLRKLSEYDFAILVQDQGEEGLKRKGQIIEEGGLLRGINEGDVQTGKPSSLINTGACVISKAYFKYPPVKFTETEYGLPHTLVSLSKDIPVHVVRATSWIQITSPQDLVKTEKLVATSKEK